MCLVFFDFDKTLTKIDTTLPFASFLSSKRNNRKRYILWLCIYLLFRFKLVSNHGMKQWFVKLFLCDESVDQTTALAKEFFHEYLNTIKNQEVVNRLVQYAEKDDEIYIVSANFTFILTPLQDIWPIRGVIATQPEINKGCFNGILLDQTCNGKEKLMKVISRFGEKKVREATVYGDNVGDLYLLEYAKKGYMVQFERESNMVVNLYEKAGLFFKGVQFLKSKNCFKGRTRISLFG